MQRYRKVCLFYHVQKSYRLKWYVGKKSWLTVSYVSPYLSEHSWYEVTGVQKRNTVSRISLAVFPDNDLCFNVILEEGYLSQCSDFVS
jgi:hypothetical protein